MYWLISINEITGQWFDDSMFLSIWLNHPQKVAPINNCHSK